MTAALAERALSTALEDSLITTLDAEVIRACLPPGAGIAVLRPHLRAVLKQRRRERLGLRVVDGGCHSDTDSIGTETGCLRNVSEDSKKTPEGILEADHQQVLLSVSRMPLEGVGPLKQWLWGRGYLASL